MIFLQLLLWQVTAIPIIFSIEGVGRAEQAVGHGGDAPHIALLR